MIIFVSIAHILILIVRPINVITVINVIAAAATTTTIAAAADITRIEMSMMMLAVVIKMTVKIIIATGIVILM